MNEFCRQMARSGAYALLAIAFVLGCSLLVGAEETTTRVAQRPDPTEPPSLAGSTTDQPPEESAGAEPGAGR
jgi:hypothetical protein